MKSILLNLFFLFCLVVNCFSQSAETIKKINKIVKPFFIMSADSLWNYHGYYKEVDLDEDHISEIIVSAIDTVDEENKIFVFKIDGNNLKIIDSCAPFFADGFGPI